MAEKRKIRQSTRTHGESPLKRRLDSPSPSPPIQIEPPEEGLPFRIQDDQDLPTLSVPQDKNLCPTEYQSIAESGVLLSSLDRSRQKWLTDGVFERYWAKPSKKRASVDSQNPAKESMTRLGVCSMIVEPHIFETTLYTVKEPQSYYPPNPQPQPPPDMRFSSFSHVAINTPTSHNYRTAQPNNDQQQSGPPQLTLPPFKEGFAQFGPRGTSNNIPPIAPDRIEQNFGLFGINGIKRDGVQAQDEKPNADPVIQMLATRAASNHDLKALMKVVASGNASQSQLRDFQNHIDDLNTILKKRNKPFQTQQNKNENISSTPLSNERHRSDQLLLSTSTLGMVNMPNPAAAPVLPKPSCEAVKQEPLPQFFSHYTQLPKPKSATSCKSDVSAIVFDLGGSGDRFSFPRFSILEYLPGGTQVVVSFLVIRRGNAAVSKGYKATTSYYQPVTMRLSSPHPRVLDPLARVVAPAAEVRRYMNNVFDKMSPADNAFLATRLPRPKDSTLTEKDGLPARPKADHFRATYSPPNALVPLTT